MFEQGITTIAPMTYREAGACGEEHEAVEHEQDQPGEEQLFTEEEVRRRVADAVQAIAADRERAINAAVQGERESCIGPILDAAREFDQQRIQYFEGLETHLVRLVFAIARKVLHREANMDPELMCALVRIALERMQNTSSVRIRVHPSRRELWVRSTSAAKESRPWEIVDDATLDEWGCFVVTESGSADFGLDSQLQTIEEGFASLLARRPPHEGS